MRTFRIRHATTYEYEAEVKASFGRCVLLPRELPSQRCLRSELRVEPGTTDHSEHLDLFGNRVAYFSLRERHRRLKITAESLVEVEEPAPPGLASHRPWEEMVAQVATGSHDFDVDAVDHALPSPRIAMSPAVSAYAAPSFTPGRPLLEAVLDLSSRIHADFDFVAGQTSVDTTVEQVLAGGAGVCQDFAHLGVACARSVGLPARYVSGYLETDPPPGQERLVGADVSHAWFSVMTPDGTWIDVDPTNDRVPGVRHIVTAFGRDYSDVAPVSGVIFTEGRTTALAVEVDVAAA